LKTTSKRAYFFTESFEFWRYYRQMAFYRLALAYEYPGYSFSCFMPVVDTQFFTRHCFKISDTQLDRGDVEYTTLIKRIKWHLETQEFNYSMEEFNNHNLIIL
jgi:hypothetical protein